jgi:general secretion pathway protein J
LVKPNHRAPNLDSDEGFSLVEVLVTLSVTSVLSLLLIFGTSQIRSILTTSYKNDAAVEVEALANYLDSSLRNARLLPLISEVPTQQRPALLGSTENVRFVGVSHIGAQDYSLREVNLYVEKSSQQGASNLMQTSKSRRLNDKVPPLVTELASIENLTFEYRSKDGWLTEWVLDEMPLAIRFNLSITRKNQQVSATRTVRYPWAN